MDTNGEELERYRIKVELEGRATPASFELILEMARMLMNTTNEEWEMRGSEHARMVVTYLSRKEK